MIRVGEIVEGREIDAVDTHCGAGDCESGYNPGDGGELGPSEPEETDWEESGFDAGEIEAGLGGCEVETSDKAAVFLWMLLSMGEVVGEKVVLVDGEDCGEDCTD